MAKPKVFIGSSSEGLPIAEAVFSSLSRETEPTLWTHQLFLPGHYPLEILEKQLAQNSFAVLVASPDDELIKRGAQYPAMRDNLLLEFGLFVGALGRRHAFFICPSIPKVELPSDLLGVITAVYDATRVSGTASGIAGAVEIPCQQIREVIKDEWAAAQRRDEEALIRLQQSKKILAVQRFYTIASRLRDAVIEVQRDAFAAFSDAVGFEEVKCKAIEQVNEITESFAEEARLLNLQNQLEELRTATAGAVGDLPFPQELSIETDVRQISMNAGIQAIDTFLRGQGPARHLQDVAMDEVSSRMESLRHRYSEWWNRHSLILEKSTNSLQGALFMALF